MSALERGAAELLEALRPSMEEAARSGAKGIERIELGTQGAYLKFGPLHGRSRLRHGWRAVLGRPAPRLREFDNLTWLRAHGFDAPEPLAAKVFGPAGLPSFQFLATAEVRGAVTLRAVLEEEPGLPPARLSALCEHLGRDVARLHASGFIHRDLYPRNLLVRWRGETPGLTYLDAWAGGPGGARPARGPGYDLACLFLYLPELLQPGEQDLLLESYLDAAELPRSRRAQLLARVVRQRGALLARLERKRRTTPPIPARNWVPFAKTGTKTGAETGGDAGD